MSNQTNDIFNHAVLIQLNATCWSPSKQLPPSVMEKIGNSNWVKGRRILIQPDVLKPIKAVIGRARTLLKKQALPFIIQGVSLSPIDCLPYIQNSLEELKGEYESHVNDFLNQYPLAVDAAKCAVGEDLFNPSDYPLDVRDKFRFQWRFFQMNFPQRSNIISAEVYEQELNKFQNMMQETQDLCVMGLREEFQQLISHITERLTGENGGKPKIFKSSMIGNLNEFTDGFTNRNIFNDDELSNLVDQAKRIINGVDPEDLRNDDIFRHKIAEDMKSVKASIDEAIEDMPRRRLRLPEAA